MMRLDFEHIAGWIGEHSRVLDLGCGNGDMLLYLKEKRRARGIGMDIDGGQLVHCLRRDVSVVQADINRGLSFFADYFFDFVVLSQTLQSIAVPPPQLINEMLRVGRAAVVSFPNFVHWRLRRQLLAGKMPRGRGLPYSWHDTPNVRYCSIRDFEELCEKENFTIKSRAFLPAAAAVSAFPNLLAEVAIYHLIKTK